MKRVCIITTSALGSNPRVVKEADALTEAGYRVQVIATRSLGLVDIRDEAILAKARWSAIRVDLRSSWRRAVLRMRRKLGLVPSDGCGFDNASLAILPAVLAVKADLYIAHYTGALAVAGRAAKRRGALFAFDAEDFHPGDLPDLPQHEAAKNRIRAVERRWLPGCAYVTAASPGIAVAYADAYSIPRPAVVMNCFPASRFHASATLKGTAQPGSSLYWFSQTIGADRGLENAIRAIARARSRPHLYLRGTLAAGYGDVLAALAQVEGVSSRVHLLEPGLPSDMEVLAAMYDIGLAAETAFTSNHKLALSNKQFIYLLAGLPIVMSDTPAHCDFAHMAPGAVTIFPADSPDALAAALDGLLLDPQCLARARQAAFALGKTRFNWENEKQIFLNCVGEALA